MSWESTTTYKSCKCGKGKIKVISRSDDWNRTEYSEEILCEDCKQKDRQQKEYENKREMEFNKQKEKVINYFNYNYLEKWLDYFENVKSKKEIWKIASNVGGEIGSLSSFYNHSRSVLYSKEKYIKNLIRIEVISNILKVLEIEDEELNNMIKEPLDYFNEMKRKSYNEAYASARKRI